MMTDAYHGLPTPRTTLRRPPAPGRRDLQKLLDAGRGDVPLIHLRFCCSNCGSDRTDLVATSRDNSQPW
jgi:hypothetical protein